MNETGRVSASDLVVNNIRSKIQRGELKVGDRLPVEADLARELNVGRSSLREGIKILTTYGVVESRQGEGTFITDNVARNFFEYMGFFPSKENSEYLVELRRVIEVGNIAAIYDRVTPQQYDQLENWSMCLTKNTRLMSMWKRTIIFTICLLRLPEIPCSFRSIT